MKIRWWPHTDDARVASYRLRCLQIVERLAVQGLDTGLYRPAASEAPGLLLMSKRYDPASLHHAMQLRARAGTRLVLDLCDNHLHVDNDEPRLLARADSLRRAIAAVDHVVVASVALAEVVGGAGVEPQRVTVIADAAEPPFEPSGLRRWRHLRDELALRSLEAALRRSGVARSRRMLWFGNHGSAGAEGGMADLLRLRGALERAHATAPLSLTVISNDRHRHAELTGGWQVPGFYLPWSTHSYSRAARLHGAAVIPIGLNPFTRCKTNNRVATAFLHGLNVLADTIPSYEEFGDCAVLSDWPRALGSYLGDAQRRAHDVARAQSRIAERYSLEAITARWRDLIAIATAAPLIACRFTST